MDDKRVALFENNVFDQSKYDRILRRPKPEIVYVIYFTPRSGSSYLTDLCRKTDSLGRPGERFNPRVVAKGAKRASVVDIGQYIEYLLRKQGRRAFGFEIAWGHIQRTFGSVEKFMSFFKECPSFFLAREDLVLQAISLAKMLRTKTSHNVSLSEEVLARSDQNFQYDADFISRAYRRLAREERNFEAMFKAYDIRPKRFSTEQITSLPGIDVVNMIAAHIGEEPIVGCDIQSDHKKLGSRQNEEFAERFRVEKASLVARIEAKRSRK